MSDEASDRIQVPKLPPPRKGNRTIYLADDSLWEKAKTLAGKDGISSVISRALIDFVAREQRKMRQIKNLLLKSWATLVRMIRRS